MDYRCSLIIAFCCVCFVSAQNYQPFGQQSQYDNRGQQQQYDPRGQQQQQQQQYDSRGQFDNRGQNSRTQYDVNNRDQQYGGQQQQQGFNSQSQFSNNDNCCEEYCYMRDEQPYINFATKTAYQVIYGKRSNQHKVPQCSPIQFWSINRHGTRLPGRRAIERLKQLNRLHDEIVRNYEERRSYPDRGRLCNDDLELLRRWRWNESITVDNANSITKQGLDDLRFLARRYQTRFGNLLNVSYSSNHYHFQYTDTDRTHDSYQAFIEGLFGNNAYMVHANVELDDQLIKSYKSCKAWQDNVDDNPDTSSEYRRFKEKPEYKLMVRNIFKRLGFRYTLNETIIEDMYDMCRYEKAWYLDRPSPWCSVFTKDQLRLLEYAEDLDYYYHSGYGHELNKRIGCPPLKDLYERFEKTVNGNRNEPKVSVYFTHSATIQLLLVAMGIAKDQDPLTADNYYQQSHRHWRTSMIDPFAANMAAILYQCDNTQPQDRYKVMFFLNEHPVDYPGCSVGLCNWQMVKDTLQQVSEECNLDFCERGGSATISSGILIYLFSLLPVLLFIAKL